ncbi:MAG: PQQ-dependent sugar dehydrogenase [Verrucomicrobia bacterium]|nr:PQQ-dependent sugar dehydrogenase [Verrucomicrobiota bacterium]
MKTSLPSLLPALGLGVAITASVAANPPGPAEFLRFALLREGDARRGQELFNSESRLACTRCHTVDGSGRKAGPDLSAVGDKFGRRELIEAVLNPSATIAEGYSTTILETKAGEEYSGVLKQISATELDLMGADGRRVRVPVGDIVARRTSEVSLMPEGLQAGLTLQEFADLIEYLVGLKQPSHSRLTHRGMPEDIRSLRQPVPLLAVFGPNLGLEHPVWFGAVPGESNVFLVAEHETGRIWRLVGGGAGHKRLFLDTGVRDAGTHGLLGLAFHPQFARNRKYYLVKHVAENSRFASVIFEREAAADLATDSGRPPRLILKVEAATNIDHAGGLLFGPDGYLYVGMGDTGPPEDPQGHGQDLALLLSKILRLDVDHCAPNQAYAVPPDNPFRGRPGCRPEIWAYGVREPWRFSFDRVTGDLWVGDVGQDRYEEVDIIRRGENYGWNVYEGFEPFSNRYRRATERYVRPVFAYQRHYGACVTGGYVYRADRHSSFYGVYVFGDYQSRRIFGLTQHHRILSVVRQIGIAPEMIASFSQDPAGNLYLVGYTGTIFKLDFRASRFE